MYMDDVKLCYADFIVISFVPYLPRDGFILRAEFCIKLCCIQHRVVADDGYPPV